ncbi:MAG: hypothetical protein HY959_02485 [Ignavibacteriae bacterium]|nr:hypothetical protein [Ignavibacteriota bacterium]
MKFYQLVSFTAFLICLISLSYHFFRLVKLGSPKDYSSKIGNLYSAIPYSFIGAMNPLKKESAYLHYPTYAAGILYHSGTFISFILYFLFLFSFSFSDFLQYILICGLAVSIASGIGIFIKRVSLKKLRYLSCPDDYISNLLVTAFQIFTLLATISESNATYYNIGAALLFLYLPLGKLKHSLYFFAARFHLGYYYGWRGIWPVKNHK